MGTRLQMKTFPLFMVNLILLFGMEKLINVLLPPLAMANLYLEIYRFLVLGPIQASRFCSLIRAMARK